MLENIFLNLFLSADFVLDSLWTNHFFLDNPTNFSDAQKFSILTIPIYILTFRFEDKDRPIGSVPKSDVILFDGYCVLCNNTVALLIDIDKNRVLRYSSLQGKYATEISDLNLFKSGKSVIFYTEGVAYEKAKAIIKILIKLGGFYKFLGRLLNLLPLFFLNWVYDLIASHRYHLFGKTDSCFIPKEKDKILFLP